jgi:hypothetical protein
MDWSDLLGTLALGGAKTIATALGGPLAGNVVGFIGDKLLGKKDATPEEVKQALQGLTGDQIVKLKELELAYKQHLEDNGIQLQIEELKADTANRSEVNQTMRAEAASEHWPTYSWRPFIGFEFGVLTLGVYFILPLCKIPVPTIPTEVWMAFGAILGVASWYRGRMQADPSVPTDNKG